MKKTLIYEIIIFYLILFYLTSILLNFTETPVLTKQQIRLIDYTFITFFLIEYIFRLIKAPKKLTFVKENIFDLIAMIPFDSYFRIARLMRFIRLIRLVKLSKSIKGIFYSGGLNYVLLVSLLLIIWGAFSVYVLERNVNPNINTIADALWWAVVTATTVGYGDISPITTAARIIAGILMLMGIGLIGSITGSIAVYFTNINNEDKLAKGNKANNELKGFINKQLEHIQELNDDELNHLLESIKVLHRTKN